MGMPGCSRFIFLLNDQNLSVSVSTELWDWSVGQFSDGYCFQLDAVVSEPEMVSENVSLASKKLHS